MIIQCPACQTEAELPSDKAGRKVRCSECQEVFVAQAVARPARTPRAPREKSFDPTRLVLIVGGLIAIFVVMTR